MFSGVIHSIPAYIWTSFSSFLTSLFFSFLFLRFCFYLKGRVREGREAGEKESFHLRFTLPQKLPDGSMEPGVSSRFPTWLQAALGPPSTAFLRPLLGIWVRSGAAEIQNCTHMGYHRQRISVLYHWLIFFIRTLIPFLAALSLWFSQLHRIRPFNTVTLRVEISTWEFGRTWKFRL